MPTAYALKPRFQALLNRWSDSSRTGHHRQSRYRGGAAFLYDTRLKPGIHSPSKGYFFVAEDGRPSGAVRDLLYIKRSHFAGGDLTPPLI